MDKLMGINIAVCDDNQDDLNRITGIIDKLYGSDEKIRTHLRTYTDPRELVKELNDDLHILILDIEMPELELNGFDVARILRQTNRHTKIIFLTNHEEWALDGYEYNAFRYLFKSYQDADVAAVLEACFKDLFDWEFFSVKDIEYNYHSVRKESLLYITSYRNNSYVVTKQGDFETRRSLSNWCETLGDMVVRCHKSFLVCSRNIADVLDEKIVLDQGPDAKKPLLIPVSRRYRPEVIKAHNIFLKEHGYLTI